MATFRGTVEGGGSTVASRLGTVRSGLHVEAQSWSGKLRIGLRKVDDQVHARLEYAGHEGTGPDQTICLYDGPLTDLARAERIQTPAPNPFEEDS